MSRPPFPYPVKRVSVGGKNIRIEYDPELKSDYAHYHHDDGLICMGVLVTNEQEFYDTLRHELFHAGLGISGLSFLLTDELDEAIARCVENIFLPAIDILDRKMKKKK
jgi:hypothetical protein